MQRRQFIALLRRRGVHVAVKNSCPENRRYAPDWRALERARERSGSESRACSVRAGAGETRLERRTNVRMDYRFSAGDIARMAMFAKELVAMKPDVIVARSTPVLKAVAAETSTIPLVFIGVSDPVGEGLAASLARPGGNSTGLPDVESAMAGKWVELLKDITPGLKRVTYIFNPQTAPSGKELRPFGRASGGRPRCNRDLWSRSRALRH